MTWCVLTLWHLLGAYLVIVKELQAFDNIQG